MPISVELFGLVRAKAGVAWASATGTSLGEVLVDLARQYPGLAGTCIEGRQLQPGFTANLDGQRFVRDPRTPLSEGDSLLLLSLDAGG